MIMKFRAWDKRHKQMGQVKGWSEFNGGEVTLKRNDQNASYVVSADDTVLMQSTGLFDENGVEIFEGDIVQTTRFVGRADATGGFYEYDKDYRGIVKMLEGCWLIDTGTDAINLWSEVEENIIIGNIYENPELVEEKNV